MKKLLFLILLPFLQHLLAEEAILQLDTGGHTATIRDIIVTQSKDIISTSDDKTIRVWDSKTGREKRKILGEIGAGNEGKTYAIALSPDEKYLAAGGYFGNSSETWGNIRIYSYPTGKLIRVLKSHSAPISDLAFSQDGSYLVSSSADRTAKIWDISGSFSLKDTIYFHTNWVQAVKIIKKGANYFAVTASHDHQVALYDMQKREVIKSKNSNYKLDFLVAASNLFDGRIAVNGYGKEIGIYGFDLRLIKRVKSETLPFGLAYSADGKLLITGAGTYPYNVNIYQSKNNYAKKTTFKKHANMTMAVAFLDSSTAVSGGGNNNEIYLWDIRTAKVKKRVEGAGSRVWSVGMKGNTIGWGNKSNRMGG